MGTPIIVPASVSDWRIKARRRLPRFFFDFIDGGANDEWTLQRNSADFSAVQLRQRVLRDVSRIRTDTELFGAPAAIPLALAPVGMTGLFARRGEVQAKRAADAAGVPYTLSTLSICSMEEVARVSDVPFWFQLYMLRDRDVVRELLERAWRLGVCTLVFTVDLAVSGLRRRDVRNGIAGGTSAWGRFRAVPLASLAAPLWAVDVGLRGRPLTFGNVAAYVPGAADQAGIRAWGAQQMDSSVTWRDIEWLRDLWKGQLVIKGILDPEDARMAVAIGAEGLVVSNHGARQLDGVASGISMLPQIAAEVARRASVMIDGGIRSGTDILRARALGADGVLIGRPYAYALAAGGTAGVRALLATFANEFRVAMALAGVAEASAIDRACVARVPSEWASPASDATDPRVEAAVRERTGG